MKISLMASWLILILLETACLIAVGIAKDRTASNANAKPVKVVRD